MQKAAGSRTILDSYCLISLFKDEAKADQIESIINDSQRLSMSSVNLAEVLYKLQHEYRIPESELIPAVRLLVFKTIEIIDADQRTAEIAASIRATHYHRSDRRISLADCFLLASASKEDTVVTDDAAVIDTAGKLGIETVAI